jgi:hypothetical protein
MPVWILSCGLELADGADLYSVLTRVSRHSYQTQKNKWQKFKITLENTTFGHWLHQYEVCNIKGVGGRKIKYFRATSNNELPMGSVSDPDSLVPDPDPAF